MADRRMFSKTIIDSDAFLDMPMSAQALYFHLAMRADDDGFVNNPRKIQRMVGAGDDDAKILLAKHFLIAFESGVVVIKHWRIHNYIQSDRYKPTAYQEEYAQLSQKPNKAYTLTGPEAPCIQPVSNVEAERNQSGSNVEPQVRIGKNRLVKDRLEEKGRATRFVPPTVEEVRAYCKERGNNVDPERWYDYYESNGWKVGRNPMKDWKAAVRTWERGDNWNKGKATKATYSGPQGDDLARLERMLQKNGNSDVDKLAKELGVSDG